MELNTRHPNPTHPTTALIRLDNLRHNLAVIRERIEPGTGVCAAVKADGYGHGAVPVARELVSAGVGALAVASASEGLELRRAGIVVPIHLLGLTVPEEFSVAVGAGLQPYVADEEYAKRIAAAGRDAGIAGGVSVHLKVDTGMRRIGCPPEDAPRIARKIAGIPGLNLAGVCTHFPVADEVRSDGFTGRQVSRFLDAVERIRKAGVDPGTVHAANSAAILNRCAPGLDMVRPGIALYGYPPAQPSKHARFGEERLAPVMELRTRIVFMKRIRAGEGVSYGLIWLAPRDTVIATLPVGYGDGYFRCLSSDGQAHRARVLIRGKNYPVVGRICMDQTLVDLGPEPEPRLYDPVVLFGPDPAGPDAWDLAAAADTIPYEITCAVSRRVPRLYTGGESAAAD